MKKLKKILLIFLGVVAVLAVSGYVYFNQQFPKEIAVEDIKIEVTPARIERGKYIFNHSAACVDCHSSRDFSKLSGPVKPGTEGMGGDKFDEELGLPGTFYARNITPYSVGNWTDGELVRAITEGISKDGSALFPIMPYLVYGKMDREDIYSVVAYLRTLPAIKNDVPKDEVKFPMSMIMKTIPTKNAFSQKPDIKTNPLAYGEYLVKGASCTDCHSPSKDGVPIPGKEFSGGIEINLPGNTVVRTANITPDNETGLGLWTKEQFIKRFKQCTEPGYTTPYKPGEFQTVMPWSVYGGMTEEDLGAIYDYLRTLPAVKNQVVKFSVKSQY